MTTYTPLGWPVGVRPPGAPGWEETATAWLLDRCPPEYRSYPVMRRHEMVLARFTLFHLEASLEATRRGVREARTAFLGYLDGDVLDRVIAAWQKEEARLEAELRSARLLDETLRGRRFVARL